MSNRTFQSVGGLKPNKSTFDLSYEKKFDCDMGQLIPIMADEVIPGDIMNIGNEIVLRMLPTIAPILHEINCFVHYFFVPYRLIDDNWEEFITGGEDGESEVTLGKYSFDTGSTDHDKYSLWDYFGWPIDVDIPIETRPLALPRTAYNFIWNEYYRDQNLIEEISLLQTQILKRAWEKDYFTSALPWQQRGIAPALPISGLIPVSGIDSNITIKNLADATARIVRLDATGNIETTTSPSAQENARWVDPSLQVNLDTATTFDVADLRLAFQIQKWLERNARGGVRYTEFLRSHFGVSPKDERLQRPEYIGGSRSSVIISEVLQTGQTATTPQGTLAGHGLTADRSSIGSYRVKEFGLIMGIMSIMPKANYASQGINRQWLRTTKYDFYFPEFANLSEQAIIREEIWASTVNAENETIFGYQGRYDEYRYKPSQICGGMRGTFAYWHLARILPGIPELNESFIECDPSKRIFASQEEPGFLINFANIIRAIRPIPISSEPGLIDHN